MGAVGSVESKVSDGDGALWRDVGEVAGEELFSRERGGAREAKMFAGEGDGVGGQGELSVGIDNHTMERTSEVVDE